MKPQFTNESPGLIPNSSFTAADMNRRTSSTTDSNMIPATIDRPVCCTRSTEKAAFNPLKLSEDNDDLDTGLRDCSHIESKNLQILSYNIAMIKKNVIDCMNFSKCEVCCQQCADQQMDELYLCLNCIYMGSLRDNHWNAHMAQSGHHLGINVKNSKIVCMMCLDECDSKSVICPQEAAPVSDCHEICQQMQSEIVDELLSEFFQEYTFNSAGNDEKEGILDNSSSSYMPFFTIDKSPIGIINIGNSCFFNCILQILLATPPLVHFFLSGSHYCNRARRSCVTCELMLIFNYMINNEGDSKLNIEKLIRSLYDNDNDNHSLLTISQQDAHEYFIKVLEKIREENYECSGPSNVLAGNCMYFGCSGSLNTSRNFSRSNLPSIDQPDYLVSHVFQGSYSLKVFCLACKHITSKFEPFIDISLGLLQPETTKTTPTKSKNDGNGNGGIKKENSINLYDCIKTFVEEETMGNGSAIYCQNCESQQQKVTKFTLNKLPTILCLHMKRFTVGGGVKKLDVKINFPLHLDLKDFIDSTSKHFYNDADDIKACDEIAKNGGTQYTLYGVVVHKGAYHSGHYLSYVRINQQWYLCDDECVQPVAYETVAQCECYILFYMKDFAKQPCVE